MEPSYITIITERMFMHPYLGTVAPESEWRHVFSKLTDKEREILWGGHEYEDAELAEVRLNEHDEWVEI